jgi:predicted dinucleotide-binding enzyme
MKIAVLGTGGVGRTLAGRLSQLDHQVMVGTRDPAATLARTEPDQMGTPPFGQWHSQHADVQLVALADAAAEAEVVVNATAGGTSLAALDAAGATNLAGKVLVDVANPLDFSQGMPPILSPTNTDSLGEQIQRAHPQARVVKTLNTMTATVMVDPARLPDSHEVFVAGDDQAAKETVRDLLRQFGWPDANIRDLGGIRAARGLEMYLPLWLSLFGTLGTPEFNLKLVRA